MKNAKVARVFGLRSGQFSISEKIISPSFYYKKIHRCSVKLRTFKTKSNHNQQRNAAN